ncbi:MAG TPA: amidohydrolase family protein [Vicinamibacteria bacterium]|nr:amidohydrolase family protein [Vicinamibacteria bacterium]
MLLRAFSLGSLLACGAALAAEAPPSSRPLAIVQGTVLDGLGGPPLPDGVVLIRGGRIEAVGPASSVAVPADAAVVDARGKTVLPGLADLHVHLQGGWNGVDNDLLGYQRYLDALLYAGVTTVFDTGNYAPFILQLRQEVAAGRVRGPRIYCVGAMVDSADAAWPDLAYAVSSRALLPEMVRRGKQARVDMLKGYVNLSDRMLRRLVEEGRREGLRVVVDQWERNGSPDLVATGIAGFAHMPTRPMSDGDVRAMKAGGVFAVTTLTVRESFARTRLGDPALHGEPLVADTAPPWFLSELRADSARALTEVETAARERAAAALAEAGRNVVKLLAAGVLLAAGTDAPYPGVFQGEGLHRELELLVAAGLTPLQALRLATHDAARVLHADGEWGSLRPGLKADVLVVSGRPHERISDTRRVHVVVKDGRIVDRAALRFDARRDGGYRAVPGLFDP